ncbi:MAG: DUF2142 domain-containing protein, partial [Chloroflexi bacterium]|nr:DUF2142 domain-containing protein [Chloroflexota bacterium]
PLQPDSLVGNVAQENHQPPLYYLLGAAATIWIDASDYPAMLKRNPYAAFDKPTPDNRNIFQHSRREFFPWQGAALAMHLARVVSVLISALAVVGAYKLARELFPARGDLALGSAAFVAFLPQFDFIAGAVSNDGAVTAMCALALAWVVRVWREPHTNDVLLLGVWLSLAAMAKPSGLLIWTLGVGAVGLMALRRRDRASWRSLALLLGVMLALTGWWFVRNQILYHDWLGVDTHLGVSGERGAGWGFVDFVEQWNEIEISFWGLFGAGNVPLPQPLYDGLHLAAILALLGLVVFALRRRREALGLLVLLLWCGIVLAFFYRWNMLVVAPHGRLLFPALSAVAVLWFTGLAWFVPARWRTPYAWTWAVALALFSTFALTQTLAAAYPRPTFVEESALPNEKMSEPVRFGDELELGAVELPSV